MYVINSIICKNDRNGGLSGKDKQGNSTKDWGAKKKKQAQKLLARILWYINYEYSLKFLWTDWYFHWAISWRVTFDFFFKVFALCQRRFRNLLSFYSKPNTVLVIFIHFFFPDFLDQLRGGILLIFLNKFWNAR